MSISSNKNNNSLPYYLKNTFKINSDDSDTIKGINDWSNTPESKYDFHKDLEFINKVHQIDDIKSKIFSKYTTNNEEIITLCSQGLNLSIELCNYCIEKGYDSLDFIKKQTKYNFDYFSEQLNHWKTYTVYEHAISFEQNGNWEKALETYLYILKNHLPIDSSYYTNPFYLALKIFNYNDAFKVYEYLKNNYIKTKNNNLKDVLNDISNIIKNLNTTENLYLDIKSSLINTIKFKPGILQTEIYKQFPTDYKESLKFILYYWNKSNFIKRVKQGRSYSLYINE